jgi:hypothetical protein
LRLRSEPSSWDAYTFLVSKLRANVVLYRSILTSKFLFSSFEKSYMRRLRLFVFESFIHSFSSFNNARKSSNSEEFVKILFDAGESRVSSSASNNSERDSIS